MKKFLLIVSAILLFTSCQESLEEKAAREAREVTESRCPMPVGDNMFLDSIVFDIPTLTQTQYFRFVGKDDNDSMAISLKNTNIKDILAKELKNTPSYKVLMNRGVNFRYIYRSTINPEKIYFDVTLHQEDYK